MSETAHSPGPWSVNDDGITSLISADSHPIAVTYACSRQSDNARLIGAAPDLLAALRAVVAVADRKTDEFDLARAAIAKATEPTP